MPLPPWSYGRLGNRGRRQSRSKSEGPRRFPTRLFSRAATKRARPGRPLSSAPISADHWTCKILKRFLATDFPACFVGESGAKVPLSGGTRYGDDEFSVILRALRNLQSPPHIRARADPGQNALFPSQPARHRNRVLVGYRNHFIDDIHVQIRGHKTGAGTLDFVRSRLQWFPVNGLSDHLRIFGFHSDRFKGWFALFDHFGHSGDRTAGADR